MRPELNFLHFADGISKEKNIIVIQISFNVVPKGLV